MKSILRAALTLLFAAAVLVTSSIASPGYVVDLTDYLDARYGVGGWTQRTGVGTGTDIGPALSDALNYLRSTYGRGTVMIPPGIWLMTTAPTAAQYSGHNITGQGSQATIVVYNANSGSPFRFSGAGGFTGGSLRGIGIFLEDGYPTSTSQALLLQGDASNQPDQMTFEDLYISTIGATSFWYDGLMANGMARTAPQGIRVAQFHNIQIFRCRNTGFYLANVVQWSIDNIGVYAGTGTGNNGYVAGGGTALTNSVQVDILRMTIGNQLNMTNCSKWSVSGTAAQVAAGTTADHGDLFMVCPSFIGAFGANTRIVFK